MKYVVELELPDADKVWASQEDLDNMTDKEIHELFNEDVYCFWEMAQKRIER